MGGSGDRQKRVKALDIVAEGTRFSKEFAAFLKGMLGQIPDYGPLS